MASYKYIREREKQEKRSKVTGGVVTVVAHIALIGCFSISGFTYLDPPPPEQEQILIEFEDVEVRKPKQTFRGSKPRAEVASKEINLVQESEGQHIGTKTNVAEEATIGDKGDVEVPEPPREKPIDKRALFASAKNKAQKDTLAAQTGRKVSDALKEGHAQGNTRRGETTGEPKATLAGRNLVGSLPRPTYNVQQSGTVVVKIWVDNYGTVQKAVAGVEGTTVTDKDLWNSARKAALGANFEMDAGAPAMQEGTITYYFRLK